MTFWDRNCQTNMSRKLSTFGKYLIDIMLVDLSGVSLSNKVDNHCDFIFSTDISVLTHIIALEINSSKNLIILICRCNENGFDSTPTCSEQIDLMSQQAPNLGHSDFWHKI
jgi:hypothetical protein